MTMNMSRKINMLLQIETCEDFIEFVGVSKVKPDNAE